MSGSTAIFEDQAHEFDGAFTRRARCFAPGVGGDFGVGADVCEAEELARSFEEAWRLFSLAMAAQAIAAMRAEIVAAAVLLGRGFRAVTFDA
ncbi:MAG TPA: hypothetical protein VFQ35_15825, partial [Polyangiaceae bacterium]|nr:hypothetical protein [Polyangiaceae bacterium]